MERNWKEEIVVGTRPERLAHERSVQSNLQAMCQGTPAQAGPAPRKNCYVAEREQSLLCRLCSRNPRHSYQVQRPLFLERLHQMPPSIKAFKLGWTPILSLEGSALVYPPRQSRSKT